MKKIAFINGSPRTKNSCSGHMINYFSEQLEEKCTIISILHVLGFLTHSRPTTLFKDLLECDAIVIISPLYIDSLPSHLLEFLRKLELYIKESDKVNLPMLYGFINCGFIEGTQNQIALNILKNFCTCSGLTWGGGIGLGGGEMFKVTKDKIPPHAKMQQNVLKAFDIFTSALTTATPLNTPDHLLLVNQNFPKSSFIFAGNFMWFSQALGNDITPLKLWNRPFLKEATHK